MIDSSVASEPPAASESGFWATFLGWSTHRHLPIHLALVAVVLMLPALWTGLQLDDYFHRLGMLEASGNPGGVNLLDFFGFAIGDAKINKELIDLGTYPWWTPLDIRLRFFRPLSAATMLLDYELWPRLLPLMHLQSLLWYGALVAAVAVLYRRIMGLSAAAALAALLYALDDAPAVAVTWLANRNAILAALFGVLCLIAHDDAQKRGRLLSVILAPSCLALALLSGEAALGTLAYLGSYAVFIDERRWSRRLAALVPSGIVLLVWAITYRHLGFGTHGSGYYVDPLADPFQFLGVLPSRLSLLLLGQWSPFSADVGLAFSGNGVVLGAVLFLAVLLLALVPVLREDRISHFWGLGMVLSAFPIATVFPSNRLLMLVGVGAMGITARFLLAVGERMASGSSGDGVGMRAARIMAIVFIVTHLVIAPLSKPASAYAMKVVDEVTAGLVRKMPDDPSASSNRLILVNSPIPASLVQAVKAAEGKPHASGGVDLLPGPVPARISRVDERTLRVSLDGRFFESPITLIFHSRDDPFVKGQEIHVKGMTIQVLEVDDRQEPRELLFRFDVPLEDPSLRWVQFTKGQGYVPFVPPPMGQSTTLQGTS